MSGSATAAPRRVLPEWVETRALALFGGGVLLLALLPLLNLSPYTHNQITLALLFVGCAMAWNWLGGFLGQVSFGHAALFGLGGFTAARLLLLGVPGPIAWPLGGLAAGLYSLVWGHPTLRLRGPYFSIATIGVGEATRLVLTYYERFTGGSSGLSLPLIPGGKRALYWAALVFAALTMAVSYAIRRSTLGLGLLAIKSDVDAASDAGVNPTRLQDLVLLFSGIAVGTAGGLYASYFSFIEPGDMLGFDRSISFVLMAVIGGVGTVVGPLFGAIVFVVLQQRLVASYPQLYLGLYGGLLILVILFEPLGLAGLILRVARRLGYRPRLDLQLTAPAERGESR